MNCSFGICTYKTDCGFCEKKIEYIEDDKVVLLKCDKNSESDSCRFGYVDCKMCYRYFYCTEV